MTFHPQPLLYLALGLVAGTLSPSAGLSVPLVAALCLSALLAMTAIARPGLVPLSGLMVAAMAAGGAFAAGARGDYQRQSLPRALVDMSGSVVLEGRIASDPRVVDDEMRFEVDATSVVAEGVAHRYAGRVRLFLRSQAEGPFPEEGRPEQGDEIRAWVDLREPAPLRTPGGFNQLEWAMREGIHAFASCKSEKLLQVTKKRAGPRPWVDRTRDRLKHSWRHVTDPLNRAVTASMVVGDEGALDAETREAFRAAGLLHLLVVSGSQVAALIIGLRRVLPRALRIAWSGCVIECGLLLAYCMLAGAEDSIVRATLMGVAFSIAVRVDLNRGGANFLAAAALVLLAIRPLDALDPGAQMSFAATLGLVLFATPLARRLEGTRVPGLLADVAAATLVATLTVAPLTLMHFHRLSAVALPANLLAAPLAVLLLYGSLATALLDAIFAPAAAVSGMLCGGLAHALRSLAHLAAANDPDWRGPGAPLPLLLGLAGFALCSGWRRTVLPVAGLLAALTLSGLPRGDGRLHLWFLDVGQGDALLIETPGGRVAAIDAGPAFERFDAGERAVAPAIWALGHRRLDFLGITHRHSDHEGGAPFLSRHFKPRRIYVNDSSETMNGLGTLRVGRGDSWDFDGVRFRVLGPAAAWPLPGRDENARSLVLEVRFGETSFLLLGDAGVLTERLLDLPNRAYDLVKVGHHGSATSSSDRLVRETRPVLAVVSVGSRNRFSHPSAKVVDRWRHGGATVWRTDLGHTLHVTSDGTHIDW